VTNPYVGLSVLDPDQQVVQRIRSGVTGTEFRLLGSSPSADPVLPALLSSCPDVVVLDVAATSDLAATIRKLAVSCPGACVIVTGSATPPAIMSRAVAAGARGFMIKPYTVDELIATVREAVETLRSFAQRPSRPERAARGRIVAVYSPKGGVGTTTVATNLAVALASRSGTKVGLVDLDLQFGDVGAALDLRSANSIAEAIGHDVTDELIDEIFQRHASGVRVLLAPAELGVVESIDAEQVIRMLEQLRTRFDYVICDLWSSFEELTTSVLGVADRVLLVTTPELPALRNLQRVLTAARPELRLEEKALVVANRYPGKAGLSRDDMTKAFGRKIAVTIPSEGISVTDAINRGVSLLDSRLRVRIARHYHELAAVVVDQNMLPAERAAAVNPTGAE
jgi:pilus assembly protein CpaE